MSKEQKTPGFYSRRFRPYPDYKDSGVEWIERIPGSWRVCPLFTVAREKEKRNYGNQVQNVLSLSYGKIIDKDISDNFGLLPESFETYQIVSKGNIILRLTDLQNDKRSLRVGLVRHQGIITSAYVCLDFFRDIDSSYAFYLLHAYDITKVFYGLGGGVRQTMKFEDLKWLPILIPSAVEQRVISSFLDRETARIDALIEKKQRLIELLQEKRTALITQAVTKGLDPTVPMKDSGVEWLGEIPKHWSVMQLKHLVPELTVGIVVTPAKYYVDDGIPCLRSLNISQGKVNMDDLVFISEEANEIHRKSKIFKDDIVVVRTGQAGTAAIVPSSLNGVNCIDLLIVRRSNILISRLLYYYLNSEVAISQADILSVGAIQAHYNTATLANLLFPIIPYMEQEKIVEYLDRKTSAIDLLSGKIMAAIAFLKEYRTALISAAVTGKIDVRES